LRSEAEELQVKNLSLEELDGKNKLTIHELETELASKVEQLRKKEMTIAQHKQESTLKTQDLAKLHAILARSRQESDPFDDQHFIAGFGTLGANIQSLVKRHFQATRSSTRWKDFESVREPDDRDYFLQAQIATQISQAFFSHNARFFNLDTQSEANQANFEDLLYQYQGKHGQPSPVDLNL